jgi:hydrogenase-4 component B
VTPLLVAIGLLLLGGLAALALPGRPRAATAAAALGALGAAAAGLPPAWRALRGAEFPELHLPWALPGGEIVLGLDALSGFFLIPLLVLVAATAVHGRWYLLPAAGARNLALPSCFLNLCAASMVLVLLARHALLFLVAWEIMSLASYLLVSFDHHQAEVRRAGWAYLVSAHIGVACLIGLYLLLGQAAGDLSFAAFAGARLTDGPAGRLAFALALLGFGIKAGIPPLHVWLPEAHAAAPSHVSALMSGILIKLGVYGLLRTFGFLEPAAFWGPGLLLLGLLAAGLGIALALYQRDLKRVLAYSSIENVGIVLVGLGLALWGAQRGDSAVALLGAGGALLHMLGHATGKGLMFLAAGNVLHGSGSKDLEQLGGLLRRMPWTGSLMVVGGTALAGLPPLSLFFSEWMILLGLIKGALAAPGVGGLLLLLAVGGLALVGGLAALCYVRLLGIALLGEPRSVAARESHEVAPAMIGAVAALAAAGVGLALAPGSVLAACAPVLTQILPGGSALDTGSLPGAVGALAWVCRALWLALAVLGLTLAFIVRRGPRATAPTWDCGYLAPSARMQYTARSFAQMVVEGLLPRRLSARLDLQRPSGIFPGPTRFSAESTDPLTRGLYQPFFDRWARRFARLHWLHRGILHLYLLYILIVVVAGLAWASLRGQGWSWGGRWP